MINSFQNHIDSKLSFLKNSKLLIAISGGIDSVVLTHLCYKIGLNMALAHCNFNLRGKESDADEDFVLQLAEDLGLEVFIESFDTKAYAETNKRSIQMAARELRYKWFKILAEQLQFDYVLTAHHADDNLETFLINFIRGTGLDGLTGIPEVNDVFVRPLLPFSRETIEAYVKDNKIQWVEDSGNKTTKYVRNKLRHDVIPVLKEINPSLLESFQKTMSHLQGASDIVDDSIEALFKNGIMKLTPTGFKMQISEIQKFYNPKAYLYRFLNIYGFTEWDDVVNLLQAQSGKQVHSSTHRLIKDRDFLLLSEIAVDESQSITILETDKQIEIPLGMLFFDEADGILDTHKNTIYIDKTTIMFPLILRKWGEGDVFYPLGMEGKKKKVSKYLKDEKQSVLDKENIWVLCSGDAIIWVVGMRGDHRFRVTDKTKHILKVELK
ncbi:tRNA lysidine(34) synthetase TilS [Mariniflexile litorale]|uniref:tRNA(Ile)-lysidine synthase n=1 Tax=Mariniflexile litorale TaxID=3045158 RepID=A0AAU7EEM5_9FLAO|nr:tRNA lysidine(34) synthetase TilS [Mariniflexile sp. KMM 9835]MDQ8213338.1 tRNA lysidine(34) synthetase TilS [Mariniflexile sp. KMM 9835]